ncbi:hypothetical protein Gpo141_00006605 [Globisporangium polare]
MTQQAGAAILERASFSSNGAGQSHEDLEDGGVGRGTHHLTPMNGDDVDDTERDRNGSATYEPMKTPLRPNGSSRSFEGGALRRGGAPSLFSRETVGLFAQYTAVGLIYGALPGMIYPFLTAYLNVEGETSTSARVLVIVPWSFKVFYGMLTDCFPICGYRRRPYMVLGWSICLLFLIIMACTPIGKPYYPDPTLADKNPWELTAEQNATLNYAAANEGGKYVVLMMFAAVGYVMSDVAADALLVEYAQREPINIRGRLQTGIYTVRTTAQVVVNLFLAFLFNGKQYGGSYDFTLSFPQVMLCLAVLLAPIIPTTWLFVREDKFVSPGFKLYIRELWGVVQTRAVYQVIAYKFFSGVFENFTFVSSDPVQRYWAKVEPRNEKLATVLTYGLMALTLVMTGRYGLLWNWRVMLFVTMLVVIVLDAFCMFLVTWDVVRSQFFWLGIPVVEQIPQGVNFIVATYVVVELAEMGHEGAIYALLTTVNNLSDPFAKTITKQVDAHWDVTNAEVASDTHEVRRNVSTTLVVMYAMKLVSLLFLPLLPPQKKATQILKATGGSSRTMGLVTVAYVGFAMVWSVMTNIMKMYAATSCLTIAGGKGCKSKDGDE